MCGEKWVKGLLSETKNKISCLHSNFLKESEGAVGWDLQQSLEEAEVCSVQLLQQRLWGSGQHLRRLGCFLFSAEQVRALGKSLSILLDDCTVWQTQLPGWSLERGHTRDGLKWTEEYRCCRRKVGQRVPALSWRRTWIHRSKMAAEEEATGRVRRKVRIPEWKSRGWFCLLSVICRTVVLFT